MLGLNLRPEFRTKRISGTMIELSNAQKTGATQRPAPEFLEISYPTTDLLSAIEAIGPKNRRPVVFIGERSEEHTSELQSLRHLVCRLLLEKKNKKVTFRKERLFWIAVVLSDVRLIFFLFSVDFRPGGCSQKRRNNIFTIHFFFFF